MLGEGGQQRGVKKGTKITVESFKAREERTARSRFDVSKSTDERDHVFWVQGAKRWETKPGVQCTLERAKERVAMLRG
jgi:hypothetical protein